MKVHVQFGPIGLAGMNVLLTVTVVLNPEQCADYCLNKDGCNAMAAVHFAEIDDNLQCYITLESFYSGPECWGSTCNNPEDLSATAQLGIWRDFYKTNPEYLPTHEPDGVIGASLENVRGLCDETSTAFGNVNYRNMEGNAFLTADDKNVVRESDSQLKATLQ